MMDHGLERVTFGLQHSNNRLILTKLMMVFSILLLSSGNQNTKESISITPRNGMLKSWMETTRFTQAPNKDTNGSPSTTQLNKMLWLSAINTTQDTGHFITTNALLRKITHNNIKHTCSRVKQITTTKTRLLQLKSNALEVLSNWTTLLQESTTSVSGTSMDLPTATTSGK